MKKQTIERIVWWVEKYTVIILIGVVLMVIANLSEEVWSGMFYPWQFVAGGAWYSYIGWRRGIRS